MKRAWLKEPEKEPAFTEGSLWWVRSACHSTQHRIGQIQVLNNALAVACSHSVERGRP